MSALDEEIKKKRLEEQTAIRYPFIMERYGVGIVKARNIIREVRKECGGGKLGAGMILPSELEYFENNPKKGYNPRI